MVNRLQENRLLFQQNKNHVVGIPTQAEKDKGHLYSANKRFCLNADFSCYIFSSLVYIHFKWHTLTSRSHTNDFLFTCRFQLACGHNAPFFL